MTPYRLYLLDLDGTLVRGPEPIPGAPEAVRSLTAQGAAVAYLTNNSAARRVETARKLASLGFPASPETVFGTGPLAASTLSRRGLRSVFVLGEPELAQTLHEHGIRTDSEPEAVLVGICRGLTYPLLAEACRLAMAGLPLLATNRDARFPVPGGFEPGAGAVVAAVEAASGVPAEVLGKPSPELALEAMRAMGFQPAETLLVGDNLATDVACGVAAGCQTFLVLSGVERTAPEGQPSGPDMGSAPGVQG